MKPDGLLPQVVSALNLLVEIAQQRNYSEAKWAAVIPDEDPVNQLAAMFDGKQPSHEQFLSFITTTLAPQAKPLTRENSMLIQMYAVLASTPVPYLWDVRFAISEEQPIISCTAAQNTSLGEWADLLIRICWCIYHGHFNVSSQWLVDQLQTGLSLEMGESIKQILQVLGVRAEDLKPALTESMKLEPQLLMVSSFL